MQHSLNWNITPQHVPRWNNDQLSDQYERGPQTMLDCWWDVSPNSFICHKSMNYWIQWWVITGHDVSEHRKRTDTIHKENKNFFLLVMTQWSLQKENTLRHTRIILQPGRRTMKLVMLTTYLTGEIMQNRLCDIIKCHCSGTLTMAYF